MRESAQQARTRQPERRAPSPLEDPQAVVGRLFLVAAERAGSRSALCRQLGLSDAELQRYLNREALPPVEVTLRAVDLIIDERTLRGVSARIWRALLLSDRP
jgi:AraC-like DNA-binding protein